MRQFVRFLISIILLICCEVFLSFILPYYLRPNLWLGYVVFTALFQTHTTAVIIGFIVGILYDILHLTTFGVNTLLFTTVGYVCGWMNKHINESVWNVQLIVMLLSSILYIFLYFLLLGILKIGKPGPQHLLSSIPTTVCGFIVIQFFKFFYKY